MATDTDKDEWFDETGLKFSCTQCGNCCSGPPGFVWFDDEEAKAMAISLSMTVEAFLDKYARKLGEKWSLNEVRIAGKYDCVFLRRDAQGKGLCSIYKTRPQQCKTWPFWPELLESKRAWKEASRNCPGMDTGKLYPAEHIRLVRASNPQV
jgi:Fe-S-cluster containining protein